jgi:hypothetical protein
LTHLPTGDWLGLVVWSRPVGVDHGEQCHGHLAGGSLHLLRVAVAAYLVHHQLLPLLQSHNAETAKQPVQAHTQTGGICHYSTGLVRHGEGSHGWCHLVHLLHGLVLVVGESRQPMQCTATPGELRHGPTNMHIQQEYQGAQAQAACRYDQQLKTCCWWSQHAGTLLECNHKLRVG